MHRYLENSICNFRSPISPWRGPHSKSLFWRKKFTFYVRFVKFSFEKLLFFLVEKYEWEISVYFGLLFVLAKTLLGALSNSALGKSLTNATLCPLKQTIWEHIWKRTVEKSQSNVTTVTLHLQCDSASSHVSNVGTHLKIHTGDKSNSVTSHLFEETFQNAQWRKFKCNQG